MMRLFLSCPTTIPQQQMLKLASKTIICRSLLSTYSLSGGHRGFSTTGPQEEIEVECLPNKKTPWLMMKPEIEMVTGDKLERFYSPAENQFVKLNRKKSLHISNSAKCIASTNNGWLGYADPTDCSVWFSNPYSNDFIQLPPLTTLPSVVDVKRDQKGSVISIRKEHGRFGAVNDKECDNTYLCKPEDLVDSVTNMAVNWLRKGEYSDSVVVAIQGDPKRLVYCPIGKAFDQSDNDKDDSCISSLEWLGLQEDYLPGRSYHQTVYSGKSGRFYTIFEGTGIQAYDLLNDRKKRTKKVRDIDMEHIGYDLKKAAAKQENAKLKALHGNTRMHYYLVPLGNGDLLLLVKHFLYDHVPSSASDGQKNFTRHETLHFDVFRVGLYFFDSLERVDSLGDRSLFVGLNQSFAVRADRIPGLRTNCIYFSDDLVGSDNCGYDHGVFDLKDKLVSRLGYEEQEKVPCSRNYPQFWVSPFYNLG